MWISRLEYGSLLHRAITAELKVEEKEGQIQLLNAANLQFQAVIQQLKENRPVSRDDELAGGDPMAEDEGEITRLIHEIRANGRDAVIAREG